MWCDTFCSMEGCLLTKFLGEYNVAIKGLEVPCLYTCPRCAAVDRSQYRDIFFNQKHMRLTSSTEDRKKGCAYDPGALMIQGALQNQTLRYVLMVKMESKVKNALSSSLCVVKSTLQVYNYQNSLQLYISS